MIDVVTLGGRTTRVQASRVGGEVVILAFVCPTRAVAAGLLDTLERQLDRRNDLEIVRAAEPEAGDPFPPGAKVSVSVYDWDAGSRRLDATVMRRLPDGKLQLRCRHGAVMTAEQARLQLGWRAH